VAAPGTGRVERRAPLPFPDRPQQRKPGFSDSFDDAELVSVWTFRRYPRPGSWSLEARPGYLRLATGAAALAERSRAAFLGIRQTESDFSFSATLEFAPREDGSEAGIALVQKDTNWLAMTIFRERGERRLRLLLAEAGPNGRDPGQRRVLAEQALPADAGRLVLGLQSRGGEYRYAWSADGGVSFRDLHRGPADHVLSRGYTGALLGLYATGNGRETGDVADFDQVAYTGFER
jgi:alpha-N-arabinofuranosidase